MMASMKARPREGDVGGPDLQRHQGVGEGRGGRCREEQQHDRAVHGERLVVLVGVVDQLQVAGVVNSARMMSAMRPARRNQMKEVMK